MEDSLFQSIIQIAANSDKAFKDLQQDKQYIEQFEISAEMYASLYNKALKLFQKESYNDALHAFCFLAFLNQQNHDVWLGFGMSLQMCKRYEAATIAYELAALYDLENPVSYFYLAKCLFAIHDHQAALEALEIAIEYAKGKDEYTGLLEQACAAKTSLLRRQ